ncbi:hypothetical protein K439DRAFT_1613813 [Ramaria rubella]|nr:hypothetical protein K439DRAFT_1613813 [Ramaria rubella]
MVGLSTVIATFFVPGPPPAPLPLLTSQTDLYYDVHHPSTVLAHEELVFKPPQSAALVTPGGGISRTQKCARTEQSGPYTKPSTSLAKAWAIQDAPPDYKSSVASSSSDLDSDDSDDEKIPKPAGEPGRPGRGGYNLQDALNWNPSTFKKLKKCVYRLIEKHLDLNKSYTGQSLNLIRIVCDAAMEDFPELASYSGSWPVMDLIKMRLKYTSVRARRKEEKMVLGKMSLRMKA